MRTRTLVTAAVQTTLLATLLATVAGCGGSDTVTGSALPATGSATPAPTSTGPTPTDAGSPSGGAPSSTAAPPPGTSRCHTSELAAALKPGEPGAGQRYATLSLTNTSARTCTVLGYGGLQPLDAAKRDLPITLTRDTGRPATLIRLTPGAAVGRTIHWGAVPTGSQPCPTPAYASIIPPDETEPLVIGWSLGPICGSRMDGWPYGVTL